MTSFRAVVARTLIGFSVLCLALSVEDQSLPCMQTNQIKAVVAVQWSPLVTGYLVEFDRLLVHVDHKGNLLKHSVDAKYPYELCGTFAIQCTQVGVSSCQQQALILFQAAKRQFQFELIFDWNDLTKVIGNLTSTTTMTAIENKLPLALVKTLNKLQQKAPVTFHRETSEFYIVDNDRHIIIRLNINTGKTDKLPTLTNPLSSILAVESEIYAVLWKMDTLFKFEWKQEAFRPTALSVKHLFNCHAESILETRNLASTLSLCCIAIITVMIFLLTLTFVNIQRMYSYNFNISKIRSI